MVAQGDGGPTGDGPPVLVDTYLEAQWLVNGTPPIHWAKCRCVEGHITLLRTNIRSAEYVHEKVAWLHNETCY